MTPSTLTAWSKKMSNYQIKPKRDFGKYGWYDAATRKNIFTGFVVTDGICNIIPGAMWFQTVEDAEIGIEAHKISGDTMEWHATYKKLADERRAILNSMGVAP